MVDLVSLSEVHISKAHLHKTEHIINAILDGSIQLDAMINGRTICHSIETETEKKNEGRGEEIDLIWIEWYFRFKL